MTYKGYNIYAVEHAHTLMDVDSLGGPADEFREQWQAPTFQFGVFDSEDGLVSFPYNSADEAKQAVDSFERNRVKSKEVA